MRNDFGSLWIWKERRVMDNLKWYYSVATNNKPAKYLICKRIGVNGIDGADMHSLWDEYDRSCKRFLDVWRDVKEGRSMLNDMPVAHDNLLDLLLAIVSRSLRACNFCRWQCRVDRLSGSKLGACKLESESRVSTFFPHHGEELVFRGTRGSGTIFFTSCNMRCAFCIHPDTYVLTDRGPKKIKDLFTMTRIEKWYNDACISFPSDMAVFSHDGREVKVTKIFKHYYSGDLIVIKPLYLPSILVTPGHEILTCTSIGEKPTKMLAKDLTPGRYVFVPRPKVSNHLYTLDVASIISPIVSTSKYITHANARMHIMQQAIILAESGMKSKNVASELGYHHDYVRSLISRVRKHGFPEVIKQNSVIIEDGKVRLKTEKRPGIPSKLIINEDLAELLGYYCAEGHVSKSSKRPGSYRIVFSFGKHEDDLINRTKELIKKVFHLEARVIERNTTVTVEISKSSLALFFLTLCGTGASRKRVPEFLFSSPTHIKDAFLRAFEAGDGCETAGYISLNTVSEELAMGLFTLYLQLGHLPSFNIYEPKQVKTIQGRKIKQSQLYYVKIRVNRMRERSWLEAKHVRYRFYDNYIMVPIYRISKVTYSGPVYNLEVDDPEHNYTANFIAVGNCQNGDISTDRFNGAVVTPYIIALMAYNLRLKGCHNINWVGGEPVIHLHNIVEAVHIMSRFTASMAKHSMQGKSNDSASYSHAYYAGEFNVPQLWNSNFFMSKEAMNILRCIIDVWLPDLKFGSDKCALRLARTPWYWDTVTSNIKQVYEWGEDMVIRHLIMPGHIECCTKPVLKWIAENTPDALVNVMDQYRPENYCDMYSPKYDPAYRDMARFPTGEEIEEAYRYADSLGLNFEIVTFEKRATSIL